MMKRLFEKYAWCTLPLMATLGLVSQPAWAESARGDDYAAAQQGQQRDAATSAKNREGAFVYTKGGTLGVTD